MGNINKGEERTAGGNPALRALTGTMMVDDVKQDLFKMAGNHTRTHKCKIHCITSDDVKRLHRNRAHRFLNQASQRCSCLLGSVVRL